MMREERGDGESIPRDESGHRERMISIMAGAGLAGVAVERLTAGVTIAKTQSSTNSKTCLKDSNLL